MSGETVLVSGGTGVIGRALVAGFSRQGWMVAFTSRSANRAAALRDDLLRVAPGARLTPMAADLSSEDGVAKLLADLSELGIRPVSLVNSVRDLTNLEVDERGRPSRNAWQREFELGVVSVFELGMALAESADGALRSIVNVSSMYGLVAPTTRLYNDLATESPVHYGVCKAALNHLTRELAIRMAPAGVRVNSVSFGGVAGRADEQFERRYAQLSPQGRMLTPADIPGPVVFLASDDSRGITGHNLVVDGGWSVW